MTLAEGSPADCEHVLERFGRSLPARAGTMVVELQSGEGANQIAPVVRALDEAGILVESLELVEPTLDDVFVEKTGQHLEDTELAGAEGDAETIPGAGAQA